MADPRKLLSRATYRAERALLIADALAIRSGRYGANGALYLEGNRKAMIDQRAVYYHRRNRSNRVGA